MKVLAPFGHSELGGSQLFFLRTVDLLKSEIEFKVWLSENGPFRKELERLSVAVDVWNGPSWKNPASWPRTLAALRHENPDLVYLHASRFLAFLSRLAGIPCMERINMTRIPQAGGWMRIPWIDRVMTGFNTHLLAVSEAIGNQLKNNGIPQAKITVVRNHVDEALWRHPEMRRPQRTQLGLGERDLMVLGAGRLVPQKSPLDFFRAGKAALQKDPRLCFIWAGEGPLMEDVRSLIASMEQEGVPKGRLRLLPFQPDMVPLMNSADIFLHTSHWDPLANVLLESMAVGLPIVASDVDGSGEALRDYPPSRLVKPGHLPSIETAVHELAGIGIPAAPLPSTFRPERFRMEFLGLASKVAALR